MLLKNSLYFGSSNLVLMYVETLKTGEMVKHTVCCRIAMKLEKVGRNIAATQRVFHRGGDGAKSWYDCLRVLDGVHVL